MHFLCFFSRLIKSPYKIDNFFKDGYTLSLKKSAQYGFSLSTIIMINLTL